MEFCGQEITHSLNEDERIEFTNHINDALKDDKDPELANRIPIDNSSMKIFDECQGIFFHKFI